MLDKDSGNPTKKLPTVVFFVTPFWFRKINSDPDNGVLATGQVCTVPHDCAAAEATDRSRTKMKEINLTISTPHCR